MDLSDLKPAPGSRSSRKRLGRGPGSGLGKTSGRGHKGRGARSGGNTHPRFEGGQMPLQRRLPKRGFHNPFRQVFSIVNLAKLEAAFESGAIVDPETLAARGLVRRNQKVKVLGQGTLSKALTVKAHAFSESAKAAIGKAGGNAEVMTGA
ncbi:MAG TPA: 50S ribosomal protein L15 [Candidatus Dormibacteraeota bacterium]|nr:50S ribosomal protein L15 [Candidatus Dormibacteraeota bacterium]